MLKKVSIFMLICFTIILLIQQCVKSLKVDYIGTKPQSYYDQVASRIEFKTTTCENETQWDSLQMRVNQYIHDHPEFIPPKEFKSDAVSTFGGPVFCRYIYFESSLEIYEVCFDQGGSNYIESLYLKKDNSFSVKSMEALSSEEKTIIRQRLQKEFLDKINWNLTEIPH